MFYTIWTNRRRKKNEEASNFRYAYELVFAFTMKKKIWSSFCLAMRIYQMDASFSILSTFACQNHKNEFAIFHMINASARNTHLDHRKYTDCRIYKKNSICLEHILSTE